MKKKISIQAIMLITAFFVITGCQKTITEPNEDIMKAVPDASLENQCRLTRFTYPGFDNSFHYNEKGLADEWKIDYGFGIPDVYTMSYDNNNKLIKAWWHFDGGLIGTIDFNWTSNLITSEHWDLDGFSFDISNTYDRKGQMVKRETSYGVTGEGQYSSIGNLTSLNFYFGGELFEKHEMTHNTPNRNPFHAIRGLPYGFPFIMLPFGSTWWETSEKVTYYDNGSPVVLLDPDPAQTILDLGFQQYLSQANYFDLVSNAPLVVPFEYENCTPAANAPTRMSNSSSQLLSPFVKTISKAAPLKVGPRDMIRKQMQQRRK